MIIEFDTCFVDTFDWDRSQLVKGENEACMVEGKSYTSSLAGENLYLSLRKAVHRQHIYCLASMRLKCYYEFMGLDGLLLLNILYNNISKIEDYTFFNLNQLRELDISNNAIVYLPVHVFQGLICLKEVN